MPQPPSVVGNPFNARIHSQIVEPPLINSPIRGEQAPYSTHVSSRSLPGMVSTTAAQGTFEAEAPPPIPIFDEQIHLEDIPSRLPVTSTTRTVPVKFVQLFIVNCWLVFFSIWGNLARLGFIGFTGYQGTPVGGGQSRGNGVLWANFAGCVIIGYLTENLELFQVGGRHKAEESQPTTENENDPEPGPNNNSGPNTPETLMPLYIGLTTGFCGSFTSFSSYMLQAFLYLSNTLPSYTHPQKGYSVLSFLGYIVLTLALSVSGLQFGAHIAEFAKPHIRFIPIRAIKFLDNMIPFLSLAVWAGSIIMAILIPEWRGNVLFACVFSPIGTLTRFWVSRILNPKAKRFPLGTFIVNIFGTAVLAGAVIGQYGHNWQLEVGGLLGCQLMRGVGDGFCGCLTTVSTWVVEIRALRRHHAYQYALSTITAGSLTMLIILGSYIWSHENLHTVNGTC